MKAQGSGYFSRFWAWFKARRSGVTEGLRGGGGEGGGEARRAGEDFPWAVGVSPR